MSDVGHFISSTLICSLCRLFCARRAASDGASRSISAAEISCGASIFNTEAISQDLDRNWAVVAEGIQTILRREQYPAPYEALKALTRTNKPVTKEDIGRFIDQLDVKPSVKEELHRLTPQTYTGIY